jgi:hypothetical protein
MNSRSVLADALPSQHVAENAERARTRAVQLLEIATADPTTTRSRSTPLVVVVAMLSFPHAVLGQIAGYPTPDEYAARALAAERAPLFQSSEPLRITLRTDIEWLVDERDDSVEVDGTVTVTTADATAFTLPVEVRARGEFRRDRRNCNFPPLRLDFPRDLTAGTVFEGENQLKLVTPCHDNRDDYQRYVYDEYLAYRVLNTLTPHSFRVRLIEITYEDVEGDYETRTKHGFLIESDERMAERNRATHIEAEGMRPQYADGNHAVIVDVFAYMIGNLDWSTVAFHNAVLIRTEDNRYLAVPYDFDFSGVVNARYANEPVELGDRVRNVRQRLYRGFCRPELQFDTVSPLFMSERGSIEDLYRSFGLYSDPEHRENALDYYEEFWRVLSDPADFEDEIVDECLQLPVARSPA